MLKICWPLEVGPIALRCLAWFIFTGMEGEPRALSAKQMLQRCPCAGFFISPEIKPPKQGHVLGPLLFFFTPLLYVSFTFPTRVIYCPVSNNPTEKKNTQCLFSLYPLSFNCWVWERKAQREMKNIVFQIMMNTCFKTKFLPVKPCNLLGGDYKATDTIN